MQLKSPSFSSEEEIPDRYRYDEGDNSSSLSGKNISPPLSIEDIPENTESIALIIKDIDNPDGTFIHWLIWDIDPRKNVIEENDSFDNAVIGRNSFKTNTYMGPNPDQDRNTIIITIYALDTILKMPPSTEYDQFKKEIEGKVIETAKIKAYCSRTGKFALE